jgi:hypothetical protein
MLPWILSTISGRSGASSAWHLMFPFAWPTRAQMQHNASLEGENAELRAELAAAHAVVDATAHAAAAAPQHAPEPAAAILARQGRALVATEVAQYKDTGLRLLELAQHSALIAAAYQVPLPLCSC